jgi:DNA-binding SARP family transcriptional activator
MELREPYSSLLQNGRIQEYVTALCKDGPRWWADMDTPAILTHLMPLQQFASGPLKPPDRLLFLADAVKQSIPLDAMDRFYTHFIDTGDYEAAAVAAGAGTASIWDSGHDYHRYETWYDRINSLISRKDDISPLMLASLYGFRGLAELTGLGDIKKALDSYTAMRSWAEKAGSMSLRTFYAAAASYSLLWMGRLSEAQIILADGEVLCRHAETSMVCKIYFQTTLGLFHTINGNPDKAEEVLREIINLPFFEMLPPPAYFLCYGHLLHALSHGDDSGEVEKIAGKLRSRAVPERNYFHYSYLHFSLGVAYLGVGNPHKALLHSKEAIERGRSSESPIAVRMPALLQGQALADIGRTDEATAMFVEWLDRWRESGFMILASAGALELANLYNKKGMPDKARQYLDMASSLLPEGEKVRLFYRKKSFLLHLEQSLSSSRARVDIINHINDCPVRIRAFGNLRINIGDKIIYDRRWLGGRTKNLLKLLIVSGGTKVPYSHVSDMLWPDADGDRAERNLKVAISRLRRLGCKPGMKPTNWIAVKDKRISLVRHLCAVDALIFKEMIESMPEDVSDPYEFTSVLDLYTDDFLAQDNSEAWIVRHREILRDKFIKGTLALSHICMKTGRSDDSIPYLIKAIEKDPLYEKLYIHLIRAYSGRYPSKAMQVFNQAKDTIRRELGVEPGPELLSAARETGLIK